MDGKAVVHGLIDAVTAIPEELQQQFLHKDNVLAIAMLDAEVVVHLLVQVVA